MPYAYITLAQAQTELANRLDDYNSIFWTTPELTFYLQEALRTWQALTGAWRGRMTFDTIAPVSPPNIWYDLTAQTGSLVSYNITDAYLISEMCYHLIEPQLVASAWVGSDQFTLDDLVQALQRRRDQFLVETGMVCSQQFLNAAAAPIGRLGLPDNIIDVRRVAWIDAQTGLFTQLYKSDEWGAESFQATWATAPANPPQEYSTAASPPITLQFIPPPLNNGQIELIAVAAGTALNPAANSGNGTLLGIPDNFAHVVKWGALADLLGRDGQPHDPFRAQYCDQRWKEGIMAARLHTSVVTSYLNGVQVFPDSVHSLDSYNRNWQNVTGGPPSTLGVMCWNLIAVTPNDGNGPYSVTMDVLQNAPVPSAPTDQLQIGREELDAILSYAQHLAAFKEAGQEFSESTTLYQRMVELAQVKNARLKAAVPFYEALSERTRIQEAEVSRRDAVETE